MKIVVVLGLVLVGSDMASSYSDFAESGSASV